MKEQKAPLLKDFNRKEIDKKEPTEVGIALSKIFSIFEDQGVIDVDEMGVSINDLK